MRTPLYEIQKQRGARFVDFGGWDMPVQFTGGIDEHMAVRTAVGLFDVSHMGEVRITGKDAIAFTQKLVTKDVEKLKAGDAVYTVMCTESGGIVDDLIVYREGEDSIFLVINAGTTPKDLAHMRKVAQGFAIDLKDLSADYALIAVQGPSSNRLLEGLVPQIPQKRFTFVDTQTKGGITVRVARTGYTGELGVEIACAPKDAERLFLEIEKAGAPVGLKLCGLGARDSLRLEKKLPLYGMDIDETTSPLEAGLDWVVKLEKPMDFVGKTVLAKQKRDGVTRKWVGFKMQSNQIPRHDYAVRIDGKDVGKVTSGLMSPNLRVGIGCAYLPAAQANVGQKIEIVVRDKPQPAEVVKTPFV
ncbi:MAG: glycine cleavage system aminomethyltransferase GcvT [Deltaproteobacteria bacterium]|nr:glycine cleavage system aminomethyltransferase GcvT [Deltaproteobacteria bacterium]